MLHIAPEACFEPVFKKMANIDYLTADLYNPQAMIKMDITHIEYTDESFDIILCNHVLEHILDDKKAIGELYRVLKRNGWAILLVPIVGEKTIEDPSIVSPEERLKFFGQEDHVRQYGTDYIDRLYSAGFTVSVTKVSDLVDHDEAIRFGLANSASGEIYYCTKK
jgi:ubiquinone/menaquinone biosynthesis C-methylase UbiE